MALWTAADVITFAPEFVNVPIPLINKFIGLADLQIGDLWGDRARHAGILLTAHLMTVHKIKDTGGAAGTGVGPVQSITVGQVSVSYNAGAVTSGVAAGFSASAYGVEFDRLSRLLVAGIAVV